MLKVGDMVTLNVEKIKENCSGSHLSLEHELLEFVEQVYEGECYEVYGFLTMDEYNVRIIIPGYYDFIFSEKELIPVKEDITNEGE